tara:strand:+ start:5778 stop:6212 length:435 start_codon:yes stop_codon:yes gene_type:complete
VNWYKRASAGWSSNIDPNDLKDAADHLSDFNHSVDTLSLLQKASQRRLGQVPIESLPDDLSSWVETETGSVAIPAVDDDAGWIQAVNELNYQTSSRDFTIVANAFRRGMLSPVIISKDGVLDGRGRVNFANALGIPVEAVELVY